MLKYCLIAIGAYLLGSINSSVLISKGIYRIDVRTRGSGNAGATNVARVFGMASGLLTLGCDALKTVTATLLGSHFGGEIGLAVAGAACVIGHCWPLFFHFKGGKGVTVGAVVALMIDWRVFLSLAVAFFAVFLVSRIVSLCSITVAFFLPGACLLFGISQAKLLLAVFVAVLVIFQHRSNIVRLLHGQEKKFSPKPKSE